LEQAASQKIIIIYAYHSASQFKDDFETIAATQVRMVFSAQPGSSTEHYLSAGFGTKKESAITFGNGKSQTTGGGISIGQQMTSLSVSRTETVSSSWNDQQSDNFSISEREVPVWGQNDTNALNDNPLAFAIGVTRREELVTLEPGMNRATAGGPPVPFHVLNQKAQHVHEMSPHTFLLDQEGKQRFIAASDDKDSQERNALLEKLWKAAERVRQAI
jgi:hypothetical protein